MVTDSEKQLAAADLVPPQYLIVGAGYLGSRVGAALRQRSDACIETSRNPRRQAGDPIKPVMETPCGRQMAQVDVAEPHAFAGLPLPKKILYSIGYRRDSPQDRDTILSGGLGRLVRWLRTHEAVVSGKILPQIVLISTTGVFHQGDGMWVDEQSPARPTRDSARAHLRAETFLSRNWPLDRQTVLRLAGIYGPGRVPNRASLKAGQPLKVDPDSFLNLIHVDDAVAAVLAAWDQSASGLYCVVDDHPLRRGDFYRQVAKSYAAPPPQFEMSPAQAGTSSTAAGVSPDPNSRRAAHRRVSNRKLRRELLPWMKYPNSITAFQGS
ncbi:MAG: hypothetical protein AAF958_00670 [Planctomycetota bacterium]